MIRRIFERQKAGMCGPVSLKIVLALHGIDVKTDKLIKMCKASKEHGTDHIGLVKAVDEMDIGYMAGSHMSIDLIKYMADIGYPAIVGWWKEDGDHFSIIIKVYDKDILMIDPEEQSAVIMISIDDFINVWYDYDGKDNRRVERWALIVIP